VPTVAGFSQTSAEEDATLSFNCSPTYLPEAAKWFTAFTLANNHTDNQGPEGFAETKQHLQENNIQYFGNYDPYVADDACEVLAIPATVVMTTVVRRSRRFHWLSARIMASLKFHQLIRLLKLTNTPLIFRLWLCRIWVKNMWLLLMN